MAPVRLGFPHLRRLEEICRVFISVGLGHWISRLRLRRMVRKLGNAPAPLPETGNGPGENEVPPSVFDLENNQMQGTWERLRRALEKLGPTFVKLGQILSNRADLFPRGLILELSRLQDQVPPFPGDQALAMVESELGQPCSKVFSSFDPVPVASASVAQVHQAWLDSGLKVAVKIQRPLIEEVMLRDLDIIAWLARLVQRRIRELRHLDPEGLVAEFRRQVLRELDFSLELHNMDRFAREFAGDGRIHVVQPFPRLSARRVLTMEFVSGTKLGDILERRTSVPVSRETLARNLAGLMLDQVFRKGFFHADPHPGNVMVLSDGKACFLDFGMMGRIQASEQKELVALMLAMGTRNSRHLTQSLLRLTGQTTHDLPDLEREVADLVDLYFDRPMGELNFGEVFQRLASLVQQHEITIPGKFLLMAKALVISEGVGSQLWPEFSLLALFEPFAARLAAEQLRPDVLGERIMGRLEEYADLVQEFPLDAMEVLRQARRGEVTLNFRLKGIEPLKESLEHTGTRMIFGFLLAALLISSSLIIRAEVPPFWNGMPVIGIVGYGIAGIMSLGFLISIIRGLWRKPDKGA